MNQEEIKNNLTVIRQEIDKEVSVNAEAISEVIDKLNRCTNLIGLSAECKAAAKRLILERQKTHILAQLSDTKFTKLSWNLQRQIIDGDLSKENELYEYAERINAGLTHCCQFMTTIISNAKQELITERMAGWGQKYC